MNKNFLIDVLVGITVLIILAVITLALATVMPVGSKLVGIATMCAATLFMMEIKEDEED